MGHLGKALQGRAPYPLGGRIRGDLLGVLRFQLLQTAQKAVVFVVLHGGIVQHIVAVALCVDVSVSILLPGFRTGTQVTNSFAVAETVIVGEVPDSYTYFDSGNPVEEDAFE